MPIFACLLLLATCLSPWCYASLRKCAQEITYLQQQPEQVHIAFGAKSNDIVVTWATQKRVLQPELLYQIAGENAKTTVKAQVTKFVDGGLLKYTLWIYRAYLNRLPYNTIFMYRVGSQDSWSKLFSFRTPADTFSQPLSIMVFGDMGSINSVALDYINNDLYSNIFDAIFHVGDFGYDLHDENGTWGNYFFAKIESIASAVPYMVCPGNHEFMYNYSHYKNRFSMPGLPHNMFYSFNLGLVHFVSINTEAYYNNTAYPGDEIKVSMAEIQTQFNWLQDDLKKANLPENRSKQPWIILIGHRPMYCSNKMVKDRCFGHTYPHRKSKVVNEYSLEPLLMKFGVDLAIWGHEHSFERTWPIYDGEIYNGSYMYPYRNPRAPTHVTTGSAGCTENLDEFSKVRPSWSAFRLSQYGYARLHVYNHTHLSMEQLSTGKVSKVKLVRPQGQRADSFWLVRETHGPYALP